MKPTDYDELGARADAFFKDAPMSGKGLAHDAEPDQHPLAEFIEFDPTVKPPRWLLPGFIGHGVIVISGPRGVGKTTAVLPLAMTAAQLHGDELLPIQWRHVVYITEDVDQAQCIMAGLVGHSGLGIDPALVRERMHLVKAKRLDPAYVAKVGIVYREKFTRTVGGVEVLPLIVLDTKSAVMALEDENSNAEASRMMAALKQGFADLPVWIVGHVTKANMGRSDIAGLTNRGAGSTEDDANATAYLIEENQTRYLVLGKRRFEPKWPELEISSHTATVQAVDEFGFTEDVTLRWGIASPPQTTRKKASEHAAEQQRQKDESDLRQEILEHVAAAWATGNPLNRTAVKAKVQRKSVDTTTTIEVLLAEQWLCEVTVPTAQRTNNSRKAFLVALDCAERDALLSTGTLPTDKFSIPMTWRKA